MNKTGKIVTLTAMTAIVLATGILSFLRSSGNSEFIKRNPSDGITESVSKITKIKIYVTGEVMEPGIIEIEKGSTILDAVEACGGFTENASMNINLVFTINKNITLIIKNKSDGGGANIIEDAGDAVVVDEESGIIDGKININHADADALALLPGIGEKTAMDIISHRNQNGPFSKIEDIMDVPGIKESKFSKIKEYICIE